MEEMDINDIWDANEALMAASMPPPIPPQQPPRAHHSNSNRRSYANAGSSRGEASSTTDHSDWRARGVSNQERRGFPPTKKKIITIPTDKVGRIIGRGGSKVRELETETEVKIKIGESLGSQTSISLIGSDTAISKVQVMINKLTKEERKPKSQDSMKSTASSENKQFMTINEFGDEVIDWPKLNAYYDEHQTERYAKLPPIVKDFYHEDPEITSLMPEFVRQWRKCNNDIQVRRTFDGTAGLREIPNPVMTFEQAFQHYPEILEDIYKQGFSQPSPIQSQGWPILLSGEDMIGIAQTGTGKTLAFLLPALIHIDGQPTPREEREGPTVLILAPTRELALQIDKETSKYKYRGIKSVCIYGGGDRNEQIRSVSAGVDIVIATPGRFNDLVIARHLNAINFSFIVLDEADRMLDMGFEPQIRKSLFDVRPDRQCIMTSATWPSCVRRLAETYMKDPIQVNVGSLDLAAVHSVTQKLMFIEEDDKDAALFQFIHEMDPNDKVIIFCGKKATASHITSELAVKGFDCQSLHGDLVQSDRETALEEILDGTVNILVATDVASRGIDIKDLTHVVNLDFPRHIEEYVHRIGRTGRAGKTGIALSFMTRQDWAHAAGLIKILEEADQDVPDDLTSMAQRFAAMKIKRNKEGGSGSGRGRGGRGRGSRRDRW